MARPGKSLFQSFKAGSDSTDKSFRAIDSLITGKLLNQKIDSSRPLKLIDIGSNEGQLIFQVFSKISRIHSNIELTCIEPDSDAFSKLGRVMNGTGAILHNLSAQEFFGEIGGSEQADFMLFTHSWYHFPEEQWKFILGNSIALAKNIIITIDSHECQTYRLRDRLKSYGTGSLEHGYLHSAEELESFLGKQGIRFDSIADEVWIYADDLWSLAGHIGFLFRKDPDLLLHDHGNIIAKIFRENMNRNRCEIKSKVKTIAIQSPILEP